MIEEDQSIEEEEVLLHLKAFHHHHQSQEGEEVLRISQTRKVVATLLDNQNKFNHTNL